MFCGHCGTECPGDHAFCSRCGRALSLSSGRDSADVCETLVGGLAPGTPVDDRYVVQRLIGVGAMGIVYLALDRQMDDDPVALKVLRPELSEDAGSVARLKNEARIARRLSHPGIVRIHTFHDARALKYIVMEYVDGQMLKQRIDKRGPFDEAGARRLGKELAEALAYAHAQGVVHRDLKPANILLTSDERPKIVDFGIARAGQEALTQVTGQSPSPSGTLAYMAPEHVRGTSNDKTDLYSLGAVLYEVASGHPPFVGGHLPTRIPSEAARPIDGFSDDFNRILLRLLAKSPDERFANATEVGHELDASSAGRLNRRGIARRDPNVPPENPKPGDRWTSPVDGHEMVWIPPGEFLMGSPEGDKEAFPGEWPQHMVKIERGFWLDAAPLTNAAWQRFVLANPEWRKDKRNEPDYLRHWSRSGYPKGTEQHPVVYVSWHDVRAYCVWAGKRLPTEAEWEYAARAGTLTRYWWGDVFDPDRAHFGQRTAPVGDKRRVNPWGLSDMLGNVWEWTSTLYRKYPYRADDGREDPSGDAARGVRGGSWYDYPGYLRVSYRLRFAPDFRFLSIGARCARDVFP